MKYLIGIDAGTTSVKAVLFDIAGNELKVVSLETVPTHTGEIYVEQDMNITWDKVKETLKEVIKDINANDVLGIGVTGQGEGCWLVDSNNQAISPASIWLDSRSHQEVNGIQENKDLFTKIHQCTGSTPQPCNAMMQLLWHHKNSPEKLKNAKHLFFCKDWVKFNLTGVASLDPSDAGTSLLDGKTLTPAKEVFEALGLGQYIPLLPPIIPSGDIAGVITKEVAEATGLKQGTPVISGCIDVQACGIGIGAVNPQDAYMILGSTCVVNVVIDKYDVRDNGSRTIPYALKNYWTELLPTLSGTPNIDWCRDHISLTKDFVELENSITKIPAGSGGVVYHPYLAGERTPFYNADARASFMGINFGTTRSHLERAVYEGLAYSLQDCIKSYPISKVFLTGGGAKSGLWAQIIADVTNAEVIVKKGSEFGAKGVALLAGLATGCYKDIKDLERVTNNIEKSYSPNKENNEIYKNLMTVYLEAREAYTPVWQSRARYIQNN